MVQYTKLVVYRDSLCLYYSSGTNNSIRINLDIRINDFNQRDKNRIKTLIKKGLIPEELELFKEEIYKTKNRANSKVSQFKTKYGRKPTTEEFKNLIKEKDFEVEEGFMVLYEEFIEFKKIDFKKSPSSLKDYISFKNSILDFSNFKEKKLSIFSFDLQQLREYFLFLQDKRPIGKSFLTIGGLDGKTIKKRLDALRIFLCWLRDFKKYPVQSEIENYQNFRAGLKLKLDKITKDPKKISLTTTQVQSIINYPLEKLTSPEKKVRDMFLFILFTGIRISDLLKISEDKIKDYNGIKYLSGKSVKTNKPFEVELSDIANEIIERNNFNMNLMTAQKGNEYLKKFLSKIDLFQIETNYYKSSDVDNQVRYKLYEIMTFHQGRRTFITNMLDKGYSAVEVMRRTDHTKISTLEKYVSPKGYSQKNKLNLYE